MIGYGGGEMENGLNANEILLLSVAAAAKLAQGRTADEISLLAAFFTVLGDNLALLALEPGGNTGSAPEKSS